MGIEFLKWYLYSNFRGALLTQSCYFRDVYVYTMIMNDSQQLWNIWCRDITSTLVETSWLTLNLGIESVMGVWLYVYIYIHDMCWDQSKQYGEICMYTYGIVEFIYIYMLYNTDQHCTICPIISPWYPHHHLCLSPWRSEFCLVKSLHSYGPSLHSYGQRNISLLSLM